MARHIFVHRSRATQIALQEKLERQEGVRLAAECAKLDPLQKQEMAEEGFSADVETWPEYWEAKFAGPTLIRRQDH